MGTRPNIKFGSRFLCVPWILRPISVPVPAGPSRFAFPSRPVPWSLRSGTRPVPSKIKKIADVFVKLIKYVIYDVLYNIMD